MARTATTLINAATVGATASEASNITELTLAAGTGAVAFEITFTPGAVRETGSLRVYWAHSITNLGAAAADVRKLLRGSNYFELPKNLEPSIAHTFCTELESVRGDYVTLWVFEPVLVASGTLTVKSIEL
jgi:hypothetical protein